MDALQLRSNKSHVGVSDLETKEPYQANGHLASPTNPDHWATYDEIKAAGYSHVGYVCNKQDGVAIIDCDDHPDNPATQEQIDRQNKIKRYANSYTERSCGGKGFHIFIRGSIPHGIKRDNVEVYSEGRYFVLTGDVVVDQPIKKRQKLLNKLWEEVGSVYAENSFVDKEQIEEDRSIVERARNARDGNKFCDLFDGNWQDYGPSQSEGDLALMSMIGFYTKNNDQAMRIFRMSELGKRDKAIKDDRYLDYTVRRMRSTERPPVNITKIDSRKSGINLSYNGAHNKRVFKKRRFS